MLLSKLEPTAHGLKTTLVAPATLWSQTELMRTPRINPLLGTYGLRVPTSRVGYVPEAQGGLPPGPHVLYVRGTSLGRWVRTAYRGNPGAR